MNNKLVFDNSFTFHTKIYFDVFNFMKNVLNRARTGTCATTGTFTLYCRASWITYFTSVTMSIAIIIFHTSKTFRFRYTS